MAYPTFLEWIWAWSYLCLPKFSVQKTMWILFECQQLPKQAEPALISTRSDMVKFVNLQSNRVPLSPARFLGVNNTVKGTSRLQQAFLETNWSSVFDQKHWLQFYRCKHVLAQLIWSSAVVRSFEFSEVLVMSRLAQASDVLPWHVDVLVLVVHHIQNIDCMR